ncbi:OmpA family protein [Hymenobacter actinosclerus]|uniref:Outer membrane protein OmpA n=1 Tax=Hymenobacter actinosclerus TaxID=82805 RepID=A0A1I0HXH9_9BACT|nr:OmpA family protein [Hymenobacter actinosclerus]SET88878.1 Outer membrane protein OmpA [Hymenobacter actinosclerus]
MLPRIPFSKVLALGITACTLAPQLSHAQTSERKTNISVYYNWLQYHGDLGSEWFKHNKVEYGAGVTVSRYIAPGLDIGLDLSYGDMKFSADYPKNTYYNVRRFDANVVNVGVPIKLKLNNGWALKEDAFIAPYLVVQPGVFFASPDLYDINDKVTGNSDVYAFDIAAAAGIKFNFSATVGLFVQTGQHYPLTDQIDGITNVGKKNDRYLQHKLGLSFNLGKMADEDGDGVSDKKDKCPGTPAGVAVDLVGCPLDGDKDGVPDYLDKCPTEAGVAALEGCPDRDGDGVRDSEDKCPDTPGKAALQGCPDADNDGVIDSEDKCPDTPAGVQVDATGCPLDKDGDGVPDYLDRCPSRPGPASNKGCPEMKVEEKKRLQEATKFIQFEFDKAALKPSSYPTLDALSKIMQDYPDYNLSISAHADSKGDDNYNLRLSDERAASARAYMLSKGVAADRIISKGYGEAKPIASNTTDAGRALNRRVEFDVYLPGDPNPAVEKYGQAPEMVEAPAVAPKAAPVKKKAPVRKPAPRRK